MIDGRLCASIPSHCFQVVIGIAGFRPGERATFVSAKGPKTIVAVARPFGCPSSFADFGGPQTRYAQTMRAFSPVSAALLGHTTRPRETSEAMKSLSMEGKLAEPALSLLEGLRQGPPVDKSVHP